MSLLDDGDWGEVRAYEHDLHAGEEPTADSLALDASLAALIHNVEYHGGGLCDCPLDLTKYAHTEEPW